VLGRAVRAAQRTPCTQANAKREAKRNIVSTLVTGIAAMSDPSGAAAANNASISNLDNNWLATQQRVQYNKEMAEAKTLPEQLDVIVKWEGTSLRQDVISAAGFGKGHRRDGEHGAGYAEQRHELHA